MPTSARASARWCTRRRWAGSRTGVPRPTARSRLLLLLDQFARNIFRGQAKAFLGDPRAREVAAEAVARGFDQRYPFPDRVFFYLPFEHCETLANQDRYIALMEGCLREFGEVAAEFLDYAHRHRNIIKRFGRFPHRNEALGREMTEEEAEFLKGPNSSFEVDGTRHRLSVMETACADRDISGERCGCMRSARRVRAPHRQLVSTRCLRLRW